MNRLVLLVAIFAVLAVVPLAVSSAFWLNAIMLALFSALIGQAWNIAGGYAGQFSFGHALFFGVGAYGVAVLQVQLGVNPWLGLVAGGALGAGAGAGLGWLTFRYGLRGSYFALVTLAFAEVFRILANSVPWTGAGEGILIPLDARPAMLQFKALSGYYWLLLALTFACFLTVWRLGCSRLGAQMLAVRDNEDAASAVGVDAFSTKLKAMALSGLFMGLAGVFYAQRYLYLDPGLAFGPTQSVEALLVAIVGGIGTLFGPLLGAFALHLLGEVAQTALGDVPGANMVIYGTVLVVMVLFLPRGLAGLGHRLGRRTPGAGKRRRARDA
ncbi:branched-chain amino acid ABC transporter permease [Acidimangrovimonas pyrenivorans]|uniref:Branched-chain amino acid ABC transporter permease n=1 Tax=Acidimangrovimonas pyrenivorans TaxID=2030798 RepID=A0ABV7AJE0_9RHOB